MKALGEMLLQDALDRGEQERDECLSRRLLVGSSLAVMNFEQWEREGRQQAKTSQPAEFGGTSAAINIGLGGGGVSGEPVDHYAQEGTPLRFVTERSYPVNYRGINQQHNPSSVDFSLGGYSSDSERLSMGKEIKIIILAPNMAPNMFYFGKNHFILREY